MYMYMITLLKDLLCGLQRIWRHKNRCLDFLQEITVFSLKPTNLKYQPRSPYFVDCYHLVNILSKQLLKPIWRKLIKVFYDIEDTQEVFHVGLLVYQTCRSLRLYS